MLCEPACCEHVYTIASPPCYDTSVEWIRAHLVLVYGLGLGVVVLTGAVLVSDKFATSGESDSYTWGSYGGTNRFVPSEQFTGTSRSASPLEQPFTLAEVSRNLQNNPDRVYASLSQGAPTRSTTATGTFAPQDDAIEELLRSIKPDEYIGNLTSGEKNLDEIYHFIPKNILSGVVYEARTLTPAQQALYTYGNEAGSVIETYDSLWGGTQANIHRAFIEDRADPTKANALERLAAGLFDVSASLSSMEIIPAAIQSRHNDLIAAYKAVGEQTVALSKTRTDDEALTAIEAYNASAEQFLRAYLAISTVFTLNSVSFSSTDPGRMFVYSESQSL